MPIHNQDIAGIFDTVGDLLDIKGENPFRVRSYKNAARAIEEMSQNVTEMVDKNEDLTELPGIGKDLSQKIEEIVRTGRLEYLKNLTKEVPLSLLDLLKIETLGPKKVGKLYQELSIRDLDSLEKAIDEGKVQDLEGFGEKTVEKMKTEIERIRSSPQERRFLLAAAEEIVSSLVEELEKIPSVDRIIIAGSYRRRKETVGDIDVLVTCDDPETVMERFVSYEDVTTVISHGSTKSSIKLRSGRESDLQVDLRVVPDESYGAALHYFTGSKAHNVAVRKRAVSKGLKINEYGVFRDDEMLAGETEDAVYEQVGLPYIEPELREDRGEIDAGLNGNLPELITEKDMKGDLQTHSTESDGKNSIKEMARAAIEMGYEYFAVTDHSQRVSVAGGMDEKRLAKQIDYITSIQEKFADFTILKSIEVDILEDGTLDLPDSILKELDIVTCSIHYNRNLSYEKQTERILRAMDNRYFNILAHPTGRLIGSREPYQFDLEKIMREAAARGCFLEINAHPERLDLNDTHARMAKEMGLKLTISTDSHSTANLKNIRYGISQARRGWLTRDDVLNTRPWSEVKKLISR